MSVYKSKAMDSMLLWHHKRLSTHLNRCTVHQHIDVQCINNVTLHSMKRQRAGHRRCPGGCAALCLGLLWAGLYPLAAGGTNELTA